MTTLEFSNEFDVLYNNITSNAAPGLSEYEKSIFLTQAQETIVVELYNGTFKGEGFEETEEIKKHLSYLQDSYEVPFNLEKDLTYEGRTLRYLEMSLPSLLFPISEKVIIAKNLAKDNISLLLDVLPITNEAFLKSRLNPFRGPGEHRILRIIINNNTYRLYISNDFFKTILNWDIKTEDKILTYILTFLKRPNPIILETLTNGLTINEEAELKTSELDPILHRYILAKAVTLAKAVWQN